MNPCLRSMIHRSRFSWIGWTWLVMPLIVACTPTRPPAITPDGQLTPVASSTTAAQISTTVPADKSDQSLALLPEAREIFAELQDAPQYFWELTLDDDLNSFRGQGRIVYTNSEIVPLEQVYLRLLPNGGASYAGGSLILNGVRVDNTPVDTRSSLQNSVVEVPLPSRLVPGEAIEINLEWHALVPEGLEEGRTGYGIYGLNDGVLALAGWYPQLAVYDEQGWNLDAVSPIGDSVYADIALYDVTLHAPEGLVVVSTGIEISPDRASPGNRRFVSGPAREFFLILSENFKQASAMVNGVQVTAYYPGILETGGMEALDISTRALRVFNQRFGEYPYSELDVVAAPLQYASGVEFPGIFLLRDAMYEEPNDPAFLTTTAHEVAHQWWYNTVGNDVFEEPWLDEALATYSALLYWEDGVNPDAAQGYQDYLQQRYDELVRQGLDDRVTETLGYFEEKEPLVYSRVVYTKGALFLAALRHEIGDTAFFVALQDYYHSKRFGIATAEDLLGAFERAAGRSLDSIYHSWLDAPSP